MAVPTVSVIVPVYNRPQYLEEAITSVLAQTEPVLEIIVVDDGSAETVEDLVQGLGPNIRYHWQSNGGAAAARNTGINLAKGGLLAFIDSDDRWRPDKLARQTEALVQDPTLAMVFGHVQQFISPDAQQAVRLSADIMPGYHVGTLLARRAVFDQVGLFETQWRVGEFVSWQAKATDLQLSMTMLPDVVMERRLHDNNMGRTQRVAASDYLHIVKAALDRRRAMQQAGAANG
ncbi:MAG: glycosyltransferase family A protein [Cyanobacteria bacterium J06632_22]